MSEPKPTLTIFLAAPDRDTGEFRRVIEKQVGLLRLAHANDLHINLKRWDDPRHPVPCSFLRSPQHEVLAYTGDPADCDLVLGVFSHHFGSQLPDEPPFERKPDGTQWYCTEWEIHRAVEAARAGGAVEVMVFHDKTPYADVEGLSRADNRQRRAQSDLVADFIDSTRSESGNVLVGVHVFSGVDNLPDVAFALLGRWINEWKKRRIPRWSSAACNTAAPVAPALTATARRRELLYLTDLLSNEFSDREERYVALAAEERRSRGFDSTLKGLRMPTSALLSCFKLDADAARQSEAPVPYDDALDAYRSLAGRRHRRLAVLGEPGAGKSFSLERIACELARAALLDPAAPLPLLVRLGSWTDEAEPLPAFLARQLGPLGVDLADLRSVGRCLLLLDGLNEIPPGQRQAKATAIQQLAGDERLAAVIVSCRERDFSADFQLPFDTLTLQPLTPLQIHEFLHRAMKRHHEDDAIAEQAAEARFWQLAGGPALAAVWATWQQAGATWKQFWTADDVPRENPNVFGATSGTQDQLWRQARFDRRGLLALAANPYLLTVMMLLPAIPPNRAQLFDGFIQLLYDRERQAREQRGDAANVPAFERWQAALVALAEALQRVDGEEGDDGARTTLDRSGWPADLQADPTLIDFAIDASVLQRRGDELRFTHQLLQESLASRVLLDASRTGARSASDFWPADRWWQRSGWEVVAEIAAEACGDQQAALHALLDWLAAANPEVAAMVWQRVGSPTLPPSLIQPWAERWLSRMTDTETEPSPAARAAIGRALGLFDLDHRPGVGLRADGVPDIDWVTIPDLGPFVYQRGEPGERTLHVPTFRMARYPVTHRQFQAFIDDGGYENARWWQGLQRIEAPWPAHWQEPNAPRESVSWYEAMAYCCWLSVQVRGTLAVEVRLPTEAEWEAAARGTEGRRWPWGEADPDRWQMNADPAHLRRTTPVGVFPASDTPEGVSDLAGNVGEWTSSLYTETLDAETLTNEAPEGNARRAVRGGSWHHHSGICRASYRSRCPAVGRSDDLGFRVVCCPIQEP